MIQCTGYLESSSMLLTCVRNHPIRDAKDETTLRLSPLYPRKEWTSGVWMLWKLMMSLFVFVVVVDDEALCHRSWGKCVRKLKTQSKHQLHDYHSWWCTAIGISSNLGRNFTVKKPMIGHLIGIVRSTSCSTIDTQIDGRFSIGWRHAIVTIIL
jgi:hypothetical protein